MWCVSSTSISVLINGNQTQTFKLQKGLRQGDLISSFLFTIIGESLNYVIRKEKQKGVNKGLDVCKDRVEITNL